ADVYLNDVSLYEVESREIVARRDTLMKSPRDPDGSPLRWYAVVDDLHTTIYACFGEADPRRERVEVTARPTCFYPLREGVNFLTIRGFHISQAATQWGAPTAEQVGMIAVHWGKGWIIEDNVISNSRCNGITLGKEFSTGHNLWSQRGLDGATEYIEVTLSALRKGWDKEHVGSHVIRRNEISFCEQTGICGSLGGAFSEIHDNHIHDIWVKNQFIGEEIGGIKLHGAVDAYIHNNRIHHCQKGIWMDWMAQGSRVSCNLLYDNFWMDLYYEVNHGPAVCDNNILLSPWALWDMSEGIAYVHNLVGGFIAIGDQGRFTPYHLDHSTEIKGLYQIICGDDRFYNNIFVNKPEDKEHTYGMDSYSGANWPVFAEGNTTCTDLEAGIQETGDGGVFLSLSLSGPVDKVRPVDSDRLGITRVSNYPYEHVDGSKLYFRKDFLGHERDSVNPVSGPFEQEYPLRVKVW
ncbi:MAG: right-handed parallel beta-helix repeat-containing protein, partial [Bacteroidales bacterium]|nr:right-handed parallel beta-helix repeat-containing protein [Bacteroidales bacterium]